MREIEQFVPSLRHLTSSAPSPQSAVSGLAELLEPIGCKSIDLVISDRVVLRWGQISTRHVYYHDGFPRDWNQRWPRYAMVDPLIPAVAAALWPVDIGQLKSSTGNSALQHELWAYLEDSGVASGIAAPVHLPGGAFAGIAFYAPDHGEPVRSKSRADVLFMIGQFFCRALVERFSLLPKSGPGDDAHLTDREVECLYWTSVGKTTEDIALILNRAPQTVRFHLDSASRKLGVVNRTSAVAQACTRGIINPH